MEKIRKGKSQRWHYKSNCKNCNCDIFISTSKYKKCGWSELCTSCATTIKNKNNKGKYAFYRNINYFEQKSLQSIYWAGFIAADGCITGNKHDTIQIKLQEQDKDILDRFVKDTKFEGGVKFIQNQDRKQYRISICCTEWTDFLEKNYNITPKKSLNLEPPTQLNENESKAFIIGYLDGNGSICYLGKEKYLKLSNVSTYNFNCWVKSWFEYWVESTRAKKEITYKANGITTEYVVYGKRALKLIQLLKNFPVEKLMRKWNKIN